MEVEEKTSLILTIVFGIILLGGIFYFGYFLGQRKIKTSLLESEMLENWMAFAKGEVKEISGRDLTLTANGESLKISISEKAVIQSLNIKTGEIKKANLSDIKVGGKLEVQVRVEPKEKILTAYLVNILF
jgi:preprotein translocase subunit YajC